MFTVSRLEFKNTPCRVSCPVSGALLVSYSSHAGTGSGFCLLHCYYCGTFWAITLEFTRWGGHTAALWAGNVQLRWPTSKHRLGQGLIGGIIAGFSYCALGDGCNLAAFFTGIPIFLLHAWAFMLTTVIGAWISVKLCLLRFLRTPLRLDTAPSSLFADTAKLTQRARLQNRLALMVAVLVLSFAVWRFETSLVLGLAVLFGIFFRAVIERGQICFTSAALDLWTTGRTRIAYGILLDIMVVCLGYLRRDCPGHNTRIYNPLQRTNGFFTHFHQDLFSNNHTD